MTRDWGDVGLEKCLSSGGRLMRDMFVFPVRPLDCKVGKC